METLKSIEERRSIRGYTKEKVSRKIVEDILNCGRLAPSAKNRQPWYFAYFFKNRLFYKLSHKKAIYSF